MRYQGIKSILQNASYLMGSRLYNALVRGIYVVIIARYLGPELYGVFNYGIFWYLAFLSITNFGLQMILSRELGKDRTGGSDLIALSFTLKASASIVAAVICGISGWLYESEGVIQHFLLILSIALVGRSISVWADWVFTAFEESHFTLRQEIIFRTLELILALFVLAFGGGILWLAGAHALIWCLQAGFGLTLLKRHFKGIHIRLVWQPIASLLAEGVILNISIVFMTWLLRGPVLMFRHIEGAVSGLGQLALVMQLFTILSGLVLSVAIAALPVLSRSVARKDGKERIFAHWVVRIAILIGTAIGCAGLGIGEWLVSSIFGTRYLLAGHLFALSLWLLIPWILGTMLWRVFIVHKKLFWPTLAVASGALSMSLCFKWFVTEWGPSGAIFAVGVGMFVWAAMLIGKLYMTDRIDIGRVLFRSSFVAFLSFFAFYLLRPLGFWLAVLVSWVVLLAGSLLFGVFAREERQLIVDFLRRG